MPKNGLMETQFDGLKLLNRGKVRDIYDLGEHLLIVATDRISAFDVVMPNPIPGKGIILTRISKFWFGMLESITPHHLISSEVKDFPQVCRPYEADLKDRSMLVKKTKPLPVECIVRGYLSGSGWKDYQSTGQICGIPLPKGLKESDRLDLPIFTPSTKAEIGTHDENVTIETVKKLLGEALAAYLMETSLALYERARRLGEEKGIIIADTKFEFGFFNDQVILIDEVLTPDSSRFWPKDQYKPGGVQQSFDKQFLRDYLESIQWDKRPPAPELPAEIIEKTKAKYEEALRILTG
ncbi:MAG: phosphoribosylaminoimidazolesuccinocarboxamide synthase [Deltaproteobacteria bacterium RBG_13_43_22]|nr:MAG: phosphoribosylaminoimidazolesuccinocarboxamide synthase [Deltaproteobacteria bacterium RBG_13_43_22]